MALLFTIALKIKNQCQKLKTYDEQASISGQFLFQNHIFGFGFQSLMFYSKAYSFTQTLSILVQKNRSYLKICPFNTTDSKTQYQTIKSVSIFYDYEKTILNNIFSSSNI